MFIVDPTRHLAADAESRHLPSKPKGRVPLTVAAAGLALVCVCLSIAAARLTYETTGAPGSPRGVKNTMFSTRTADEAAADRAAFVVDSIIGPGGMIGRETSGHTRSSFLAALEGAGLTKEEAAIVLDRGALPTSLREEMREFEKAGYAAVSHGGKTLHATTLSALQALDSYADPMVKRGKADTDVSAKRDREKPGRQGDVQLAPSPEVSEEGRPPSSNSIASKTDEDFDYSDALGELVESLNPFQTWSRSTFGLGSSMVPSVSKATGEVKVTLTVETSEGVTVTTEISKPVGGTIPTLVTQTTDSRTGEVLATPLTTFAPSVAEVSTVAFEQLAHGYYEARPERGEPHAELVMEGAAPTLGESLASTSGEPLGVEGGALLGGEAPTGPPVAPDASESAPESLEEGPVESVGSASPEETFA
ncbi:hypothetical protein [Streptomyces sp. NPDC091278]|uniref:hypothetical protein n=1 Tax=Streptomyces sp. NPDC091278 TaxID=3155301 RepID=UPI00344DF386